MLAIFQRRPVLFGAFSLFLLLVACYSLSIGLRATRGASITGDEPFYLLTTQSLLQDGKLKVLNGITTAEEIVKVAQVEGVITSG